MKNFLRLTYLVLTLAGSMPASVFSQQITTIKAKDNVYLVGDRTYSLFYVTNDGVIVIDPIDKKHSEATMKAIEKVTDLPVKYVFYSHNHWDHISGGQVFKDQGATFVSHIEAYKNIPHKEDVIMPDSTWSGNEASFTFGNKELELHYYERNHGNGMTVFRFPEHNSIFIIDMVVPDRVLYAYLPDASPKNWVAHLKEIQKLEFDDVYMAHVRAIGDRTDITLIQNYFDDLYTEVRKALKSDTPFFEIPNTVKMPQYENLKNYDEWLHMNVWRIMMEESVGQ
ncbi:MBL fold metallo-hydrolase [Fulvivirga maritima]|uniref:MBL fold metallo-hydrolase n=1 Tax=Fulvivirga maritima TaxID=2904247 RepID=UPI001F18EE8C|nr:MBL fold metallo-hydrolase [Fulvivirga maritima]UII25080.1 MBL fold metallo-hydrolase [Fulvivirga maritima]